MLTRALDLPATTTDYFTDDDGSIFEDDINALAAALVLRAGRRLVPLAALVAVACRLLPCRPSTRHTLWLLLLVPYLGTVNFADDGGTLVNYHSEEAGYNALRERSPHDADAMFRFQAVFSDPLDTLFILDPVTDQVLDGAHLEAMLPGIDFEIRSACHAAILVEAVSFGNLLENSICIFVLCKYRGAKECCYCDD